MNLIRFLHIRLVHKSELQFYTLGEGNGNPLQQSCLENPMDGGAWQAAVHGVPEWDTTERLPFHFSLSCIGERNGNPLQCSCLETPRDGGARWAAIYGVAQSRTRLKRLSSSSSSCCVCFYALVNWLPLAILKEWPYVDVCGAQKFSPTWSPEPGTQGMSPMWVACTLLLCQGYGYT